MGFDRHRHQREVLKRRLADVVDRMLVAEDTPGAAVAQTCHAVEFAHQGRKEHRSDMDYLEVTPTEALELVRALIPFVRAVRTQPEPEGGWPSD